MTDTAKSIEDNFADWEANVFGFGYGSGEPHTIAALKTFLAACPAEGAYDYQKLEAACGPAVAWLLINTLAGSDILEYGTSPRFAWLTPQGRALKQFVDARTVDELLEALDRDDGFIHCSPASCNCGPNGYEADRRCSNPFWK